MAEFSNAVLYTIVVPNKAGEGAKVLGALRDAGVSFCGVWGYPLKGKKAAIDCVPVDPGAFSKAARKLKLEVSPKKPIFHMNGPDQPGVLAAALEKLAAAGVNVHAAQATCSGEGRYGAFLQVADADVKAAKKALSK